MSTDNPQSPPLRITQQGGGFDQIPVYKMEFSGATLTKVDPSTTRVSIASASTNSAGLAGTGGFYVTYAADATLSAEKTLTAGSSITIRTDSTAIYVDANTAWFAGTLSVGSGGTGTNTHTLYSLLAGSAGSPIRSLGVMQHGALLVGSGLSAFPTALNSGAQAQMLITSGGTASGLAWVNTSGSSSSTALDRDVFYFRQAGSANQFATKTPREYPAGIYTNNDSLANTTFQVNTAWFIPMVITRSSVTTAVKFWVNVTGADSVVQLGLYTNSSDTVLYPFQAVATSGVLTGTNLNTNIWNVAQTLSQNNLYWFCIIVGTAAETLRSSTSYAQWPLLGCMHDVAVSSGPTVAINLFRQFSNGLPASVDTGGEPSFLRNSPYLGVVFGAD